MDQIEALRTEAAYQLPSALFALQVEQAIMRVQIEWLRGQRLKLRESQNDVAPILT